MFMAGVLVLLFAAKTRRAIMQQEDKAARSFPGLSFWCETRSVFDIDVLLICYPQAVAGKSNVKAILYPQSVFPSHRLRTRRHGQVLRSS